MKPKRSALLAHDYLETSPFPWLPGQEPTDNPRVHAIAEAAHDLVAQRDAWFNPPGLSEKELAKRTLTNLYNQRPDWLDAAPQAPGCGSAGCLRLAARRGREDLLARLLALNLERAGTK